MVCYLYDAKNESLFENFILILIIFNMKLEI